MFGFARMYLDTSLSAFGDALHVSVVSIKKMGWANYRATSGNMADMRQEMRLNHCQQGTLDFTILQADFPQSNASDLRAYLEFPTSTIRPRVSLFRHIYSHASKVSIRRACMTQGFIVHYFPTDPVHSSPLTGSNAFDADILAAAATPRR